MNKKEKINKLTKVEKQKELIKESDYQIRLTCGDMIKIYVRKKDLLFSFYCDGTGNSFVLTKEELKEMIK